MGDDGSDRGGEVVRFEVGPERVPCEGVGPQECLQVRRLPDGDWELFYGEIEGFVHEPGVATELLVRITEVDDPPADGSSLAYELVEVVERREGDGPT